MADSESCRSSHSYRFSCAFMCFFSLHPTVSLSDSSGLRLESKCNFCCTKTLTSGTRGGRNILQVQATLLSWTIESYWTYGPVTRYIARAYVSACVQGVTLQTHSFFFHCKPFIRVGVCSSRAVQLPLFQMRKKIIWVCNWSYSTNSLAHYINRGQKVRRLGKALYSMWTSDRFWQDFISLTYSVNQIVLLENWKMSSFCSIPLVLTRQFNTNWTTIMLKITGSNTM